MTKLFRILFILASPLMTLLILHPFLMSCTTTPTASNGDSVGSSTESSQSVVDPAKKAKASDQSEVVFNESATTIETLSREILNLQTEITQFVEPLTVEQATSLKKIKENLNKKESQLAKLELHQMLGELSEELNDDSTEDSSEVLLVDPTEELPQSN